MISNSYRVLVLRAPDKAVVHDDFHNVAWDAPASQADADAEAMTMLAKRMKFVARRKRKEAR